MLSLTETKILGLLFNDLTKGYSIREISLRLNLPYPQVHRTIQILSKKNLIKKEQKGKSQIINLILEEFNEEYFVVESVRKKNILKNKTLRIIDQDLDKINKFFICILFGSYAANKTNKSSDIDLLFVIPKEYNYGNFERIVKSHLTLKKIDFNITTEEGLLEMWNTPLKLNVGNEILKKHIVFRGTERFLRLRKRYYVG